MRMQRENFGSVVAFTVLEARIDGPRGVELRQLLAQVIREGYRWIVLDLTEVGFIDSTGLSAMVSTLKLLNKPGEVALCGTTDAVRALLRLTRMDKVFLLFPARRDAVAALAARP